MSTGFTAAAGTRPLGRVVVAGAGAAGLRFAQALRRGGYAGDVTLLGDEPGLPYHRPLLSKDVLSAKKTMDDIRLCTGDQFDAQAIRFLPGVRAVGLDAARRHVLVDGAPPVAYDTLVIATGVRPRALPADGATGRVFTLHSERDCAALSGALAHARRVAVVGGGFVGSEIAATLRGLGADVELIVSSRLPLERVMGEWVGRYVARLHAANGVGLRTSARAAAISATAAGARVRLADGGAVDADVVVVGAGSSPATEWLVDSGLALRDGVLVDADGATSEAGVWAIGDVARRVAADGSSRRVEHWTEAVEQADRLAAHLLGLPASVVAPVDYLWTDLYGLKIQMFGDVPAGADEHVLLSDDRRFLVAYTVDGRLRGVIGRGVAGQFMRFRTAVSLGLPADELLVSA